MVNLTGSREEEDFLPDVDSQGNTEGQGDVEQSGNIHDSSQGGRRRVDGVGGTQRELDQVNSKSSLNMASHVREDTESLTRRKRKVPTNSLVVAAM